MASHALPEQDLHRFLRRRRQEPGRLTLPPLGQWLAHTLDLGARLVPSRAGSLLLDDPGEPRPDSPLCFVAAFGPTAERLIGVEVPPGGGIVGRVYRTGETYTTSAPAEDPSFFPRVDELSAFRTRSIVAAPIVLEQTVCGVFELVNRKGRGSFSDRDVELVELLARYVSRAILNAVDVLKQNELALRDELTGLWNIRGLEAYIEESAREGEDVSVLFVDVDRLKQVNDELGHHAGSEALLRVARALERALGERGRVFRFGGDEFVLVCPGTAVADAETIAGHVRGEVARATAGPMRDGRSLPPISISMGIASLAASLEPSAVAADTPVGERLLIAADKALYRAKRSGRDRFERATFHDDTLRLRAIED